MISNWQLTLSVWDHNICSYVITCDNPKYIDTVSDIYKNRPSAATANAKPSNDWKLKKKTFSLNSIFLHFNQFYLSIRQFRLWGTFNGLSVERTTAINDHIWTRHCLILLQ